MNEFDLNKISVVLITYNHERYIEKSIDSILKQTEQDFEFIIVDDESTDKTREIISKYSDPRIKKIFKKNEGPSIAMNIGIDQATSPWIVLMSGDDVSLPNRLAIQKSVAEMGDFDFIFALPNLINEHDIVLNDSEFDFFFKDIPSKEHAIFRKLFDEGNFFCAPSAFFKKDCYQRLGGSIPTSLQLQDFALWIEATKYCRIKLINERLINYRLHSNNLSGHQRIERTNFENKLIYRNFFEGVDWHFVKAAFPEISYLSKEDAGVFEIEKTFLMLRHSNELVRSVGVERLFFQMQSEEIRQKIALYESFEIRDFFKLTQTKGY